MDPEKAAAIQQLQQLREEQRIIATKRGELQIDVNEHNLVIDTLREVDQDRRCFRMIGGVLVERTVKEVLPSLMSNKDKVTKLIETMDQQIDVKEKAIQESMEKHNLMAAPPGKKTSQPEAENKPESRTGILAD